MYTCIGWGIVKTSDCVFFPDVVSEACASGEQDVVYCLTYITNILENEDKLPSNVNRIFRDKIVPFLVAAKDHFDFYPSPSNQISGTSINILDYVSHSVYICPWTNPIKNLIRLLSGTPPGSHICSMQRGSTVDTMGAIWAIPKC